MDNLLELLIPVVAAIVTGIIGPLILFYYKNKTESDEDVEEQVQTQVSQPRTDVLQKVTTELDKRIQSKLDEIRNNVGADRAWIMEFHNGGAKIESIESLKKFSMVYESIGPGISSEQENFENLLISFFIQTISDLIEDKELLYDSIESVENHEIIRIFEQKGNTSMYMFAMESIDSLLIGILGVDYVRESYDLTEEEKQYLKNQSYSLAGYIENKKLSQDPFNNNQT